MLARSRRLSRRNFRRTCILSGYILHSFYIQSRLPQSGGRRTSPASYPCNTRYTSDGTRAMLRLPMAALPVPVDMISAECRDDDDDDSANAGWVGHTAGTFTAQLPQATLITGGFTRPLSGKDPFRRHHDNHANQRSPRDPRIVLLLHMIQCFGIQFHDGNHAHDTGHTCQDIF